MSTDFAVDLELLVADVCLIAAVSAPTFHETERAEWIRTRLAAAPGAVATDAVGNVIWRWGDEAPELLVTAHMDTVFAASTELGLVRTDGRLVGPGAGDNAAAIAVVIHVVEQLLRGGGLRPGAVAFTVCEEGLGDLRGAREAVRTLRPRAVLALEGHGLEQIVADAHGSLRARIGVTGPGGHAWVDRGRPSAVHALIGIASGLLALADAAGPVNIGLIEGGISVNAIAPDAALVVEKRAPAEPELAQFRAYLESLECEPPLELSVSVLGHRPAGRIDRDAPLLRAVLAVREDLGLENSLQSGSTDANAAVGASIPALSLGVAYGKDMHTIGESIDICSLELGARQLAMTLRAVLGP